MVTHDLQAALYLGTRFCILSKENIQIYNDCDALLKSNHPLVEEQII